MQKVLEEHGQSHIFEITGCFAVDSHPVAEQVIVS